MIDWEIAEGLQLVDAELLHHPDESIGKQIRFLQLGPINLTRCRFEGQTYGGSYQILRREGPGGVGRYIAYLQDAKKKTKKNKK